MSESTSGFANKRTTLSAISDGGMMVKRRIQPSLHAASSAATAPKMTTSRIHVALRMRLRRGGLADRLDRLGAQQRPQMARDLPELGLGRDRAVPLARPARRHHLQERARARGHDADAVGE